MKLIQSLEECIADSCCCSAVDTEQVLLLWKVGLMPFHWQDWPCTWHYNTKDKREKATSLLKVIHA